MIKKERMKVLNHKELAPSIFELTLQGELVSEMNQPGQFVQVKTTDGTEPLLRRPISISSYNNSEKQFTMIYRAEGKVRRCYHSVKRRKRSISLDPLATDFPFMRPKRAKRHYWLVAGLGSRPCINYHGCWLRKVLR